MGLGFAKYNLQGSNKPAASFFLDGNEDYTPKHRFAQSQAASVSQNSQTPMVRTDYLKMPPAPLVGLSPIFQQGGPGKPPRSKAPYWALVGGL